MPRVTKSVTAKARHKKVLNATKGHYGARSRLFRTAKQLGVSYSKLINGMASHNIKIDRKVLSDISINDSATFETILKKATS